MNNADSEQPILAVAAIQMVSQLSIEANMQRAEALVREAAAGGARFILLPENFACFANRHALTIAREQAETPTLVPALAQLADELNIVLCAGTLPLLPPDTLMADRAHAACLTFDSSGEQLARYNKIHLFDADVNDGQKRYQESASFLPGSTPVNVTVDGFGIGMSVCYDLRFSALYQLLRQQGADVFVVPSAFTAVTGRKHWQVLLQARAVEHQCYVVAANQGGIHDSKRETYGHSMIIDPDGQILGCVEQGEGIVSARIERSVIDDVRRAMPCFKHRRLN